MKVVIVSFLFEAGRGGATAVVQTLARYLADRGIEVVVVTTHNKYQLDCVFKDGIKIYSFRPKNLYWVADKDKQPVIKKVLWQFVDIWNFHTYRVIKRILANEKPNVVHIHKLRGLSTSVWTAAHQAGFKNIIHTCHDHELMSPEGTLSGRIGQWAQNGAWPIRPYHKTRAYLSRHVTIATAPSLITLQRHLNFGFFRHAQHLVIPNSHGMTQYQISRSCVKYKSSSSEIGNPLNILYLGRLDRAKGIDVLCKAFIRCADQRPDIYLHIAGDGPLATSLRQQYSQHPQIVFHGMVFGEQKEQCLSACDLLVVPSTCQEVFGIVIAEAYAYGKPVIGSAIGAIPELIQEEKTGYLVSPQDEQALVDRINWMADHREKMQSMSSACFAAAQNYTIERVMEEYLNLYQSM